jgi:hypothetical protein
MMASMSAMNAPSTAPTWSPARPPSRLLQRKCACGASAGITESCKECQRSSLLQRRAGARSELTNAPPIVHEVLRSPGQPLDPATRAFMEPRLGRDFSRVRVHADRSAANAASAVQAVAYTVGNNLVFGRDQYAPHTQAGRRLIAHELTHAVQQTGAAKGLGSLALRDDFALDKKRTRSPKLLPIAVVTPFRPFPLPMVRQSRANT